jgi:hypothetical protein
MEKEDPIVYLTLTPYTSMDLGARSLVSGVDCNDPGKSPILEFVCYFLFRIIVTFCIIMHLITLHIFVNTKIIWSKLYYFISRMVLESPPFSFLILK